MMSSFTWQDVWLECSRCEHRWLRRDMKKLPGVCPKCKSPYWNKNRIRKVKVKGK
jgi:Zn finger protein HypA/HybF involved in hydrogenase expression